MDLASEMMKDEARVASVPSVLKDGNRLGHVFNRELYRKVAGDDIDP